MHQRLDKSFYLLVFKPVSFKLHVADEVSRHHTRYALPWREESNSYDLINKAR